MLSQTSGKDEINVRGYYWKLYGSEQKQKGFSKDLPNEANKGSLLERSLQESKDYRHFILEDFYHNYQVIAH